MCIFNFNKRNNNTACDGAQLDGMVLTINSSPLGNRQAELLEFETSLIYMRFPNQSGLHNETLTQTSKETNRKTRLPTLFLQMQSGRRTSQADLQSSVPTSEAVPSSPGKCGMKEAQFLYYSLCTLTCPTHL